MRLLDSKGSQEAWDSAWHISTPSWEISRYRRQRPTRARKRRSCEGAQLSFAQRGPPRVTVHFRSSYQRAFQRRATLRPVARSWLGWRDLTLRLYAWDASAHNAYNPSRVSTSRIACTRWSFLEFFSRPILLTEIPINMNWFPVTPFAPIDVSFGSSDVISTFCDGNSGFYDVKPNFCHVIFSRLASPSS